MKICNTFGAKSCKFLTLSVLSHVKVRFRKCNIVCQSTYKYVDGKNSSLWGNSMLNLQKNSKSLPNVMDFHKILYTYAPCKSELNKKKLSFYHVSFSSYAILKNLLGKHCFALRMTDFQLFHLLDWFWWNKYVFGGFIPCWIHFLYFKIFILMRKFSNCSFNLLTKNRDWVTCVSLTKLINPLKSSCMMELFRSLKKFSVYLHDFTAT